MSEALQTVNPDIVASLVLQGDLSKLSQPQKVEYYNRMCERLGLDPLTQPFKLLSLSGKQVLYCDRSGAQQLNKKFGVSHQRQSSETVNEIYVVCMRATLPDGRFTESLGAVNIGGLKGDNLANALMKCETKAKRRSTLDLLGLGMLDETEIETIPNAKPIEIPVQTELPPSGVAVPVAPAPANFTGYTDEEKAAIEIICQTFGAVDLGSICPPFGKKKLSLRELSDADIRKGINYAKAELSGDQKAQYWVSAAEMFLKNPTEMTV